jgi:hypothetical protein
MMHTYLLVVALGLGSASLLCAPSAAAQDRNAEGISIDPVEIEPIPSPRPVKPIPEPAAVALFAVGLGVTALAIRRSIRR